MSTPTATKDARLALRLRLPLADFALELEFESSARCLGVFGPSGSGKTSLLETIAGWRRGGRGRIAVGGRVLCDGERGIDLPLEDRAIGYVPQDALLFPHWTVEQNLRAGMGGKALDAERVASASRVLGIAPLLARAPRTLSGGERQRVALARAILAEPALYLLEEPLGGVEVELRRRILPWLVRLRDAARAPIVFVSHDPTEVQVLCDEVIVLERGAVVLRGAPGPTLRRRFEAEERFENVLAGRVVDVRAGTAAVELGEADSSSEAPGGTPDAIGGTPEAIGGTSDTIGGTPDATGGAPGATARIWVPRGELSAGDRVAFALDSDDVLVARAPVEGLSARNALAGRIVELRRGRGGLRVDLALLGAPSSTLSATLTEEAVRELGLEVGRTAVAVFKSSSCRILTPRTQD